MIRRRLLFVACVGMLAALAAFLAAVSSRSGADSERVHSGHCQTRGHGVMVDADPHCTPGSHAFVNRHIACTARLHPRKDPTERQRHAAFRRYGVPYSQHSRYELDHKVPVFLRGRSSAANLWPQRNYRHSHGAFVHNPKDWLETEYVYPHVCSGRMSVAEALRIFEGDWRKTYRRFPRMTAHNERCAYLQEPPSLRDPRDCNCGALGPDLPLERTAAMARLGERRQGWRGRLANVERLLDEACALPRDDDPWPRIHAALGEVRSMVDGK
jgi:hypothetical protein